VNEHTAGLFAPPLLPHQTCVGENHRGIKVVADRGGVVVVNGYGRVAQRGGKRWRAKITGLDDMCNIRRLQRRKVPRREKLTDKDAAKRCEPGNLVSARETTPAAFFCLRADIAAAIITTTTTTLFFTIMIVIVAVVGGTRKSNSLETPVPHVSAGEASGAECCVRNSHVFGRGHFETRSVPLGASKQHMDRDPLTRGNGNTGRLGLRRR
jgi:hypothetical protein